MALTLFGAVLAMSLGAQAKPQERAALLVRGDATGVLAQVMRGAVPARFAVMTDPELAQVLARAAVEEAQLWEAARRKSRLGSVLRAKLQAAGLSALAFVSLRSGAAGKARARLVVVDLATGLQTLSTQVPAGTSSKKGRLKLQAASARLEAALARLGAGAPVPPSAHEGPSQAPGALGETAEIEVVDAVVVGEEAESIEVVELGEAQPVREPEPHKRHVEALIIVRAQGGVGARSFTYHQPLIGSLREYQLLRQAAALLALDAYPLKFADTSGHFRQLGATAEIFLAPGLHSVVEDTGARLETRWREWRMGPALRLELSPCVLAMSATYGALDFTFRAPEDPAIADALPGVRYRYVRLAAAAEIALGDAVDLDVGVALRLLFAVGPRAERSFPRSEQAGFDAHVGVAVPVLESTDVVGQLRYTHVYYAFKAEPGDDRVAGGALDLYGGLYLGARHAF